MKVHEFQGKEIFKRYGIPVPQGQMVTSVEDAHKVAQQLGGKVVVKAQIHAGGRGKGGGVKVVDDANGAKAAAEQILGMTLVTHQTGPEGKVVKKLLVEEASAIATELYLGVVLDRETSKLTFIASSEGGMSIEEVAANTPELIHKVWVDPTTGMMPFQARDICFKLGLAGQAFKDGVKFILNLYELVVEEDASLAEINPLIVTEEGMLLALDAKINFDDNAAFRHKTWAELRDLDEEEPLETEASKYGLNYIKLSGNVGCMVNGAGLAMATMDMIKLCGGEPANFLDVGGGASKEGVTNAFNILMADKDVKCVLINIFGGMVRCDKVAGGVIDAISSLGNVNVPIVVRLEGTNAKEGIELIKNSGMDFHTAEGFYEAAKKAASLAGGA